MRDTGKNLTAADDISLRASLAHKIARLQGPILVLGASGFVGANLLKTLLAVRDDVVGTVSQLPAWRLDGTSERNVRAVDLLVNANLDALLQDVRPRTVFNCVAYGAYSFETDAERIYQTNFILTTRLLSRLAERKIACYVHAGSSSEYGDQAAGPTEGQPSTPNSDYAVSKAACAGLLHFYGTKTGLPCANLRLYSVYGPLEDAARLIPNVVACGLQGRHPEYVSPMISRDFVYIDDVCEAFLDTALNLCPEDYGKSFNIGSGVKTTIGDVAAAAATVFEVSASPIFTRPNHHWDVEDWFADVHQARERLRWQPRTRFEDGLLRTADWYRGLGDAEQYRKASKRYDLDTRHSVSAVIACYKDGQAIPVMYERLKTTFTQLGVDYEIIFVNDASPDESEETIRAISSSDRRVLGISHSRNFGSQAAFRSGMELATKNACVFLDGDLQDPPELIAEFVERWRDGYDVVYGRRTKREAPLLMQAAYKVFYRVFDRFSYLEIPHDAGDFALIDRRVVQCLLRFPERDLFLRGLRAFAGFRQCGVDYVRPERLFGRSTNNLARNIGWAKKGILSFSNAPLTMLSTLGTGLFVVTLLLALGQILFRVLAPSATPKGLTTVLLAILFFGSINLFALGVIGEYVAKIFEESKQRPHFIRNRLIRDGEARAASPDVATPGGL